LHNLHIFHFFSYEAQYLKHVDSLLKSGKNAAVIHFSSQLFHWTLYTDPSDFFTSISCCIAIFA